MTVTELTELLDTSESTIRRDLTQLHKRGALLKVHGGATVLNGAYTTKDAKVSEREGLYVEEKRSIAKLAAALIGQEDLFISMQERAQRHWQRRFQRERPCM